MKARCLIKLGRPEDASNAYESALSEDPANIGVLPDAIEHYTLMKEQEKAFNLLRVNSNTIENYLGPYFAWYITALDLFLQGNNSKLREWLAQQPAKDPINQGQRFKQAWEYSEALAIIANMPTQPGYNEIKSTISLLQGNITLEQFNNNIS